MLAGRFPFHSDPTFETNKVCSLNDSSWDKISLTAIDLVKQTLEYNPSNRITLEGILNHSWILRTPPAENIVFDTTYMQRIKRSTVFYNLNKWLGRAALSSEEMKSNKYISKLLKLREALNGHSKFLIRLRLL